jgi:hypothetical protein
MCQTPAVRHLATSVGEAFSRTRTMPLVFVWNEHVEVLSEIFPPEGSEIKSHTRVVTTGRSRTKKQHSGQTSWACLGRSFGGAYSAHGETSSLVQLSAGAQGGSSASTWESENLPSAGGSGDRRRRRGRPGKGMSCS